MLGVSERVVTGPGADGFLLLRPPGGPTRLLGVCAAVPDLRPDGRPSDPVDRHACRVAFGGAERVFPVGTAACAVPGMLAGLDLASLRSAGSNGLRSAILSVVVGRAHSRADLATAVARSRVHHDGGGVDVAGGVSDAAMAALHDGGCDLHLWTEAHLCGGGVSAVEIAERGPEAGSDSRRGGWAFGMGEHGEVFKL